jgi:hypothetical protein
VTLTWILHASSRDPKIHSVIINHVDMFNHTARVAEASRSYGLDTWTKTYLPSSATDVVLDIHPEGTLINLSLWDLDEDDTGLYRILLAYEDNIFELQHRLWLYISTGMLLNC